MNRLFFKVRHYGIWIVIVLCAYAFVQQAKAGGGGNQGGGSGNGGGTNSTQSPSGNTAAGAGAPAVNLGASMLSYEAQENIAEDIARDINKNASSIKHIFITTNQLNSGGTLLYYSYVINQLEGFRANYHSVIDPYDENLQALNASLFHLVHIRNLSAFVTKLKAGASVTGAKADPASGYLFNLFSVPLRQRISAYTTGDDDLLKQELVIELNWIIRQSLDAANFPHAQPSSTNELDKELKAVPLNVAAIIRDRRNIIIDEYYPALDKNAVPEVLPLAAALLPQTFSDAVTAFNTLVGFVSTTTTLNGATVAPDEMGVIPTLARALKRTNIIATYADLYADASYQNKQGSLIQMIIENGQLRVKSDAYLNGILPPFPASTPTPAPAPAAPGAGLPPSPQPAQANISVPLINDPRFRNLPSKDQQTVINLVALNQAYDSLLTNAIGGNLSSFMVADFYQNNISGVPENGLLYVRMLYAGGENRIKSNPLWNLFTDGPRYSYAGGAVLSYILIDSSGNIALSGTARDLVGYEKIKARYWIWPFAKHIKGNLEH